MPNKKQYEDLEKLLAEAESHKIEELKRDNLRLLKQLEKAKNKKADMIDAVYEAVSTNLRVGTNLKFLSLSYTSELRTKR